MGMSLVPLILSPKYPHEVSASQALHGSGARSQHLLAVLTQLSYLSPDNIWIPNLGEK